MVYRGYKDAPYCFDETFYKDREPADHVNQPGYHRERLLTALELVSKELSCLSNPVSLADFGCGTGGLLNELHQRHPEITMFGYDMSPQAIRFGRKKYNLDLWLGDFTRRTDISYPNEEDIIKKSDEIEYPDILILTETLEHLVDPYSFIYGLYHTPVRSIIASVPDYEGPGNIGEHHLWAWTDTSFCTLFTEGGYSVLEYFHANSTQYVRVSTNK